MAALRRKRMALAASLGIGSLALTAPGAQAWDPARFYDCDWKFKGRDSSGAFEVTYFVENSVDPELLAGVTSWDAPLTRIKLRQVASNQSPDFFIRSDSWAGNPAGMVQRRSTGVPNPCAGAQDYRMPKGDVVLRFNSSLTRSMSATIRRELGAHEMGHVLAFDHIDSLQDAFGNQQTIMHARGIGYQYGPRTITPADINDGDGFYSPGK